MVQFTLWSTFNVNHNQLYLGSSTSDVASICIAEQFIHFSPGKDYSTNSRLLTPNNPVTCTMLSRCVQTKLEAFINNLVSYAKMRLQWNECGGVQVYTANISMSFLRHFIYHPLFLCQIIKKTESHKEKRQIIQWLLPNTHWNPQRDTELINYLSPSPSSTQEDVLIPPSCFTGKST